MTGDRVVVYTTDFCGWCERAKSLLAARGVRFREVWLPRTPEGRERLAEAAPLARSFPQILIDGQVVGGYRELVERDRQGSLAELTGTGGERMSAPERRERAREQIARRDWEGALVTPGVNFEYMTGAPIERSERLTCLGLSASGNPWIVCPAFEADRLGEACPGVDLIPWEETEDPFAVVAKRLAGGGTWAIEPTTSYHDAARIEAAATAARFVDGAEMFQALRRAKDEGEIAALRRAISAAWQVHNAVVPRLAAGVTEKKVAGWIADEFATRGYDAWSLVQFGPGSAIPHGDPSDRALARGQAVLIDWGGWGEGVSADLTRTTWWDGQSVPPEAGPDEFRGVAEVVRAAQRAALELAGPGVLCGDVDEAARSVIRAAGYGERFTHRLGHGLGREIHEQPYLVAGSRMPLAPGDVVTVEPGIYLPGRFGFRWEDDVLITKNGIEVLSRR